MPKQFLLNSDGSIPANVNVEALKAENIPLVMPTPMPRADGMVAIEQNPQQDNDGVWRQVWVLEPAPPTEPTTEESVDIFASLSKEQKVALLAFLQRE